MVLHFAAIDNVFDLTEIIPPPNETDSTMPHYPALTLFALTLVALFAKTTLTSLLQIVSRFGSRRFLLREDARLVGVEAVSSESFFVQRCAKVWRNDVENLPLFLMLALTYVLLGATHAEAVWLFSSYVVIRYLHTIAYLRGMQPMRTILYLSGMAVCWIIVARILVKILA
jgi:glutathione S-transferase